MGLNILAWVKAKKYTDNAVSQTAGLHREIVQTLPLTGDEHVIYMVPVTGSGDDNYNEYMWINGAYELIGNTRVDLTDYYNKTQVDAALSGKANTATTLAGYGITDAYTKSQVDTALSGKQSSLTFDNAPTQNSNNPVKSGGVYSSIEELKKSAFGSSIDIDSTTTSYTCPNDGYIRLNVMYGESATLRVNGQELIRIKGGESEEGSIEAQRKAALFVRKGMYVSLTDVSNTSRVSLRFYPIA